MTTAGLVTERGGEPMMSHESQGLLDTETRQGIGNSWGGNPLAFLEGSWRLLCFDWLESSFNIFYTKRFSSYFPL